MTMLKVYAGWKPPSFGKGRGSGGWISSIKQGVEGVRLSKTADWSVL
jgi:hypothetical protein